MIVKVNSRAYALLKEIRDFDWERQNAVNYFNSLGEQLAKQLHDMREVSDDGK